MQKDLTLQQVSFSSELRERVWSISSLAAQQMAVVYVFRVCEVKTWIVTVGAEDDNSKQIKRTTKFIYWLNVSCRIKHYFLVNNDPLKNARFLSSSIFYK